MPLARPYSETVAWTEVVASGDGALLLRDALWVCQDRPSRVERVLFTVHFYINRLCWGDVYNNTYSFLRWWKKLVYNCWKNKTGIFTRISSMSDVVKNISSVSRKKIRLQLARKRSNFCISTIKIHWTFELQEQFIRFVYMLLEEIHGTQFPIKYWKKKKHLL